MAAPAPTPAQVQAQAAAQRQGPGPVVQDGTGLAIIIVIDASVAVAEQWQNVVLAYITHIMRRLATSLANQTRQVGDALTQFQIGIITYASQNTRPTPIIRTRYFVHPHVITRQLKDEADLGIGRSPDGGEAGMATLEAFIAALELFESHYANGARPLGYHIVHIAGNPPSRAARPAHNSMSCHDDISWDALPNLMKKRGVDLTSIFITPQPQLEEFHQKVAANNQPLWFPTSPNHKVLVSLTIPKAPPPVKSPVKTPVKPKPEEVAPPPPPAVDRTPKPKQEPEVKVPTPTPPQPQNPVIPQPPTSSPATNRLPAAAIAEKITQMFQAFKKLDAEAKVAVVEATAMKQAGKPLAETQAKEAIARDRIDRSEKLRLQLNLPQIYAVLVQLGHVQPGVNVESFWSKTRQAIQQKNMQPQQPPPQSTPQNLTPTPVTATPATATGSSPFGTRIDHSDQMARLTSGAPQTIPNSIANLPSTSMAPPTLPGNSWTGILYWSGQDPNTKLKRELKMMASARGIARDCRWILWPNEVYLTPQRKIDTLADMQSLINRTNAGVCLISYGGINADTAKESAGTYGMLRNLLLSRGLVACCNFALEAESQKWTLLIFASQPTNPEGATAAPQLFGAVVPFSETPAARAKIGEPAALGQMTPQQMAMAQLMHQAQNQAAQNQAAQNQAAQGTGITRAPGFYMPGPGANPNPVNTSMAAMFGDPASQAAALAAMRHMRTPSGGFQLPAGLPPEAIQSFLKRTQGGMGGPPPPQ